MSVISVIEIMSVIDVAANLKTGAHKSTDALHVHKSTVIC